VLSLQYEYEWNFCSGHDTLTRYRSVIVTVAYIIVIIISYKYFRTLQGITGVCVCVCVCCNSRGRAKERARSGKKRFRLSDASGRWSILYANIIRARRSTHEDERVYIQRCITSKRGMYLYITYIPTADHVRII